MNKNEILKLINKTIKEQTYKKGFSLFNKETHQHIASPSTIMEPLTFKKFDKIPAQVLEMAAERGKSIHEAIELSLMAKSIIEPPKAFPHFEAFKKFINDFNCWHLALEFRVVDFSLMFGGIIDFIGYIDDKLYIIDWKTTASADLMTWGLQLFIYKKALESWGFLDFEIAVVWLKKDGDYEFLKISKNKLGLYGEVFKALMTLQQFKRLEKQWNDIS